MSGSHKDSIGQFSDPRELENAWFQERRANLYAELQDAKASALDSISPQLEELEGALAEAQRENRAHDTADLGVQIAQLPFSPDRRYSVRANGDVVGSRKS